MGRPSEVMMGRIGGGVLFIMFFFPHLFLGVGFCIIGGSCGM